MKAEPVARPCPPLPAQEVSEVVGEHEQVQPHRVVFELPTREPGPFDRLTACSVAPNVSITPGAAAADVVSAIQTLARGALGG